jgi:hypothetical protein
MIINLGFFSILQLTLIPGIIITRFVKIHGFIVKLLLSIGLSPIINYLFVLLMTTLGIYNRTSTFIFIGVEICVLIVLFIIKIPSLLKFRIDKVIIKKIVKRIIGNEWRTISRGKLLINLMFITGAFGMLIYYFIIYGTQYSTVFTTWDAVVSWNRWAMEWFGNHFPIGPQHYPQLLPTNLSMTYQIIGDERVQFFAKYFCDLIEIFIISTVFILGVMNRKIGYFIGTIIVGWLQLVIGSQGSGYADTPVSFWALLAFTCLILAKDKEDNFKYIVFGAVFAAGAAVTKQVGLWIAIVYPILFCIMYRKIEIPKKKSVLLLIALIYLLIIAPWYGFIEYSVINGKVMSEIPYLQNLTSQGKTILEILAAGLKLIVIHLSKNEILGWVIFAATFISVIFSLRLKWCSIIFSLIIAPVFVGWMMFFSYDIRNINLIVPFIGILAGFGIQNIIDQYYENVKSFFFKIILFVKKLKLELFFKPINKVFTNFIKLPLLSQSLIIGLPVLIIIFSILPRLYSNEYMISKSISKQREMGVPLLNQSLYDYFSENGIEGKILSDYMYLGFLPDLKEYYVYGYPNSKNFIDQFNDPQVAYALVNLSNMTPDVRNYIDQLVNEGKLKILFGHGDQILYLTCKGECH